MCGEENKPQFKRDYPSCFEKCCKCQMHRKFILGFNYFPFETPHGKHVEQNVLHFWKCGNNIKLVAN
jgi:hypothetical protein